MAGTALKIYNQTVTTYNTIFNNLKYFNSKQIWTTAENALMNSSVQNTYGETAGSAGSVERPVPERKPCLEDHEPRDLRYIIELLEPGSCRAKPAAFYPRAHRGDGCSIEPVPLSKRERLPVQPNNNLAANNALNSSIYDTSGPDKQRSRTAQPAQHVGCSTHGRGARARATPRVHGGTSSSRATWRSATSPP